MARQAKNMDNATNTIVTNEQRNGWMTDCDSNWDVLRGNVPQELERAFFGTFSYL